MPWCVNCSTDLAASFFEVYSPEWPCRDWCIRCRLANECNMHETHKLTLERQLATALLAEENARKIEALSNLLLSMNNKFQETNTHQHMHHANSSMHKQTQTAIIQKSKLQNPIVKSLRWFVVARVVILSKALLHSSSPAAIA